MKIVKKKINGKLSFLQKKKKIAVYCMGVVFRYELVWYQSDKNSHYDNTPIIDAIYCDVSRL